MYKRNAEEVKKYNRIYFQKNKKKMYAQRLVYRSENRDLIRKIGRAAKAVERAIQSGQIIKPLRCSSCKKKDRLQGHHHKGYAKKNYLNVVWLCVKCHQSEDRKKRAASVEK